jgi:hypothetical protein
MSHEVVTLVKQSILKGKTKKINNICIICFSIYFNGNFKNFDMSIWVRILRIKGQQ